MNPFVPIHDGDSHSEFVLQMTREAFGISGSSDGEEVSEEDEIGEYEDGEDSLDVEEDEEEEEIEEDEEDKEGPKEVHEIFASLTRKGKKTVLALFTMRHPFLCSNRRFRESEKEKEVGEKDSPSSKILDELLVRIISFLAPHEDLASGVCKRWNRCADKNAVATCALLKLAPERIWVGEPPLSGNRKFEWTCATVYASAKCAAFCLVKKFCDEARAPTHDNLFEETLPINSNPWGTKVYVALPPGSYSCEGVDLEECWNVFLFFSTKNELLGPRLTIRLLKTLGLRARVKETPSCSRAKVQSYRGWDPWLGRRWKRNDFLAIFSKFVATRLKDYFVDPDTRGVLPKAPKIPVRKKSKDHKKKYEALVQLEDYFGAPEGQERRSLFEQNVMFDDAPGERKKFDRFPDPPSHRIVSITAAARRTAFFEFRDRNARVAGWLCTMAIVDPIADVTSHARVLNERRYGVARSSLALRGAKNVSIDDWKERYRIQKCDVFQILITDDDVWFFGLTDPRDVRTAEEKFRELEMELEGLMGMPSRWSKVGEKRKRDDRPLSEEVESEARTRARRLAREILERPFDPPGVFFLRCLSPAGNDVLRRVGKNEVEAMILWEEELGERIETLMAPYCPRDPFLYVAHSRNMDWFSIQPWCEILADLAWHANGGSDGSKLFPCDSSRRTVKEAIFLRTTDPSTDAKIRGSLLAKFVRALKELAEEEDEEDEALKAHEAWKFFV